MCVYVCMRVYNMHIFVHASTCNCVYMSVGDKKNRQKQEGGGGGAIKVSDWVCGAEHRLCTVGFFCPRANPSRLQALGEVVNSGEAFTMR